MRAVVQRVAHASVDVAGQRVGEIGAGVLILLCAMQGDTEAEADRIIDKIIKLRIFKDAESRMNLSLRDTGGAALVVSQFTLAADLRGNRPGFSPAASPDLAERLYLHACARLEGHGITTARGIFGADMAVSLVNDGPVTITMDTTIR